MLAKADIALVRDYIYESFPELEGRVAIRHMTPLPVPRIFESRDEQAEYHSIKSGQAQQVIEEFIGQLSGKHAALAGDAIRRMSYQGRTAFKKDCTSYLPFNLPLNSYTEDNQLAQDLYLIAQFPRTWNGAEIYQRFMGVKPDPEILPAGFGQAMKVFAITHEFGHAALGNGIDNESDVIHERQCDILGYAGMTRIMGEEIARPAMRLFKEFRQHGAETTQYHHTAEVLDMALKEGAIEGKRLSARDALQYGAELHARFV